MNELHEELSNHNNLKGHKETKNKNLDIAQMKVDNKELVFDSDDEKRNAHSNQ